MIRQALQQSLRSSKNKVSKLKHFRVVSDSKLTTPKPNVSESYNNTQHTKTLCSFSHHGRYFSTANFVAPSPAVTRSEPGLVGPAGPTPRGVKKLSFLDDRHPLRRMAPMLQVYRYVPSMRGKDPARVIRDALAQALVPYYPLAGRLREGADGRLSVDCTGEGVLFVEADADVELHQLGDPPQPHLPWFDDFLYDVPTSGGIVDSPLFHIQVTRLKCGGFVLALRFNHIMCDGSGLTQFLNAVGEIARGAHTPSVTPVWNRELFTFTIHDHKHKQKQDHPPRKAITPMIKNLDLVQHSFFLGPSKLSAIRRLAPDRATTFELLTAYLWKCHVSALDLDREDKMFLAFAINARDKANNVVPFGYYGNAVVGTLMSTSAREICESPIEYALGLVKKGKEKGTKEYMSWRTDRPITLGIPSDFSLHKCLNVSDIRGLGYGDVDFGWGKAVYAGVAKSEREGLATYSPYRNHNREDGIVVTMCLQAQVMESFKTEVENVWENLI